VRYTVGLINPVTNEQRIATVELSDDQVAAAHASPDWMSFVQRFVRVPKGFLFKGCAVTPVFDS
jgi:hypothetical protein